MKQFTFYKLYLDILDGMNDTDAGKFAMRICEYEFEDKLPEEELNDKERFYWNNIADMLAEVKEVESSGRSLKRYNLRSEHFTFYETYFDAMKLLKGNELGASTVETDSIPKNARPLQVCSAEEVSPLPLTYEQFRSAHHDLQGDLFGNAERYKTTLDWADVATKLGRDIDLQRECDIYRLIKRYEQKYGQKG